MKWRDGPRGGERLFLGAVEVAAAFYDGLAPRDEPNKYVAGSRLPGVNISGRFARLNDAKEAAEKAVKAWLQIAGLATNEAPNE